MRILLAGDTHGDKNHLARVFKVAQKENCEAIIQLGDFGYGWELRQFKGGGGRTECGFTRYALRLVKETGIHLSWFDGNHENFDHLELLIDPDRVWADGTYEIADGVNYIPRGTMLNIEGCRILVCGGGTSIDKDFRRTEGKDWWRQEEITYADVDKCATAGQADVLLTHDFPWEVECVDRHLDPYWGQWAQDKVIASRKKISTILWACRAPLVVHGHLHHHYNELIRNGDQIATVYGLDCNETPMPACTQVLETNYYASGGLNLLDDE